MASSTKPTSCADYHVAWICPVADIEFLPARLMLDKEHPTPPYNTHYDENTYVCGTINGHAVVVATCPPGETGNVNAGRLTGSMFKTFPNIRMAVLVGIGGGIPSLEVSEDALKNLHLGDVVVGWPGDGKPACVYHDRGRSKGDGQFEMVGTMGNPDWRLINALGVLVVDDELGRTTFTDQLARLQRSKAKTKFTRPGLEHDKLFKATYHHAGDYRSKCTACDPSELVQRPQRSEEEQQSLVFHRGRIATGNAVIRDAKLRDEIRTRSDGALCVEMEAAGVDVNRRCLIIRGISDYADSHKSDVWQSYATGNAAAFARELLCRVQPGTVKEMEGVTEAPWLVPLSRPRSFVGRESQLAQLTEHIALEGCRRLAVYGLGGCGKTALALEAAYQTREQHPARAVFWVPVVSQASFEHAYRGIGMLLHIPGIADAKADVKQLVKAWLSDEGVGQWLMVIDNADDVSVLFDPLDEGGSADRLIDYLPRSRQGSIVFTTRTAKAAVDLAESNVIELGKLDVVEAKKLLRARLFQKHYCQLEDEENVHKFLSMLSFLALAIVQATAFIEKNNITLSDYISLYRASEQASNELLSKDFGDQGRYSEIKNPVTTTWSISFDQIRKHNELAAQHLSFIACMANTEIPVTMLLDSGSVVEQTEAIGTLKAYAFITEQQQGKQRGPSKAFDVHPLVHVAIRSWLQAHGQWEVWAEKALERLLEIVPFGDHETRETWTAYLPHALHVMGLPEMRKAKDRVSLLERVGSCRFTLGQYKTAEESYRLVVQNREEVLGPEDPDTLASMANLALVLASQGKYKEAEMMNRQTLARLEKVLGPEHPNTLASMGNLALVLYREGNYEEAEVVNRQTMAQTKNVLGSEHPDTLTSMNNLASVLNTQGKYEEAEAIHRQTLALREKVLGPEHPNTLMSIGNLASVLEDQGKYKEAETMNQQTLARREKVLGPEHPETLASMGNLAAVLARQCKYKDAEAMNRQTLVRREKVLGSGHPDTLMSMSNLASVLYSQGKYEEAGATDRQTLARREEVLGPEHPDTLISMGNLVSVLESQSKYEEAEAVRKQMARIKVLGPEHPDTLASMSNYAHLPATANMRATGHRRVLVPVPETLESNASVHTKKASKLARILAKVGVPGSKTSSK